MDNANDNPTVLLLRALGDRMSALELAVTASDLATVHVIATQAVP